MPRFTPKQESEIDKHTSTDRGNRELRRCEHRKCDGIDADPYFTTSLKEVRSKGPRRLRNKQPKWFCRKHRPKKVVSPTDGKVRTIQEYEAKRGIFG